MVHLIYMVQNATWYSQACLPDKTELSAFRLQSVNLRANVTKNQTFSKYCGNSSKINSAHILMLGRP